MAEFDGKVAFVTGAGAGIGKAAALAFAREGASVAVSDADGATAEETAAEVTALGVRAIALTCDISQEEQVDRAILATVAEFGRIDCAFNNAGIRGARAPLFDIERDDFSNVLDVNVTGTWLCLRAEAREMLKAGGGAIVNMSSMLGMVGGQNGVQYVASKHAIAGLTRSAALELAPKGIRVNAVAPGVIETPLTERLFGGLDKARELYRSFHPIGRLAVADEVAQGVLYLCSGRASFVVGHVLPVDGGYLAM